MTVAQNILVILPSPMGDAILATAALKRLRSALPQAKITFLASNAVADVLADSGLADETMRCDIKAQSPWKTAQNLKPHKFDAALVLPNSFRSAFLLRLAKIKNTIGYARDGRGWFLSHPVTPLTLGGRFAVLSMLDYYGYLVDQALEHLGVNDGCHYWDQSAALHLATAPQDREKIDSLLSDDRFAGPGPLVVLVPGGAFGGSKWWSAENFALLADRLVEQLNCRVFISCAPNNSELAIAQRIMAQSNKPVVNLLDEHLSLGSLKELIRRADLMVANDTGPCHIAAAFNIPLVTLFGPTDPRWTATDYPGEIRLRGRSDCSPCQRSVCQHNHACMRSLTVDQVYAAARKQLNQQKNLPANYSKTITDLPDYFDVYQERFAPLTSDQGILHSNYRGLLAKHNLDSLQGVFDYQQGQRLDKPGLRRRERMRIELTSGADDKRVIYLKRYGPPTLSQRLKRAFTCGAHVTAGCDFQAALALAKAGIDVPRPVAIGWQGQGPREKRSFVMLEELPNAEALERLLPDQKQKQNQYTLLADRRKLITTLAQLVKRLHDQGFFHRDLYLCHVFLAKDRAGKERLCLIDLQRVFQPRYRCRRWQIKDLAQLYYSARNFFTAAEIMRFLHTYFDSAHLNNQQKSLIRAVYRKTQRIARHDAKRQKRFNTPSPPVQTP
ncbi:MAG: lipopolysaccharide heptosyltransferase II [Sedimentisphaerales bacterium]|nr:lipopolysaccharide heptosyltransferase II [Sedimentisphaerales bacterium]